MDLTKHYPRSVREPFAGVVQIGRTIDKARAHVAGTVGEYHYDCPMDRAVFAFLGVEDAESFARRAASMNDGDLERWISERYTSRKSPQELNRWNRQWLERQPERGSDSYNHFVEMRDRVAPDRDDVTTWVDLLDLEEGRYVPRRAA